MSQWFQRFVASGIHGEVSDATIQGYLRSASQLEDVWQQIDDRVDALIAQGMTPWEAYSQMGYALAYVRACRTDVVFVQELVKAAAAANPNNPNYLARVTYEQALALSEHIEPLLEEAIRASTNPRYVPAAANFPLRLGPHAGSANQRFPLPHLQGTITAAQQMRDWAAGLLAKYELALGAAKIPVPPQVTTHLDAMKNELNLGDFHLRTGVDLVGQISGGQVTDELNIKAEGFLWEAMESYFKISQLVAMPGAAIRPARPVPNQVRQEPQRPTPLQAHPAQRVNPVEYRPPAPLQAHPAQNAKPVEYRPPAPAEPDPAILMNQLTTGPVGTIRPTPEEETSASEPDMLKQVIAEPAEGTTRSMPTHAPAGTGDLLKQVTSGPASSRNPSMPGGTKENTAPTGPGLLDELSTNRGPARKTPTPPLANTGDLLSEVIANPKPAPGGAPLSTGKAQAAEHDHHSHASTPEDNVMDMFSQVCGEQPNQ